MEQSACSLLCKRHLYIHILYIKFDLSNPEMSTGLKKSFSAQHKVVHLILHKVYLSLATFTSSTSPETKSFLPV